ncbi:MAG: pilus assembly protein [Gemmataceae bacterium]|nr:pilus assembly protein [Gemmataceae bacterium]
MPKNPGTRRGAAAVEFAIVAPFLILLVFGIVEFGRMLMVLELVSNGAREGARKAILPGAGDSTVTVAVDSYMTSVGLQGYTTTITPSATTATAGTAIKVTVSIPCDNVTWLPIGGPFSFLTGRSLNLNGVSEMRKEEF